MLRYAAYARNPRLRSDASGSVVDTSTKSASIRWQSRPFTECNRKMERLVDSRKPLLTLLLARIASQRYTSAWSVKNLGSLQSTIRSRTWLDALLSPATTTFIRSALKSHKRSYPRMLKSRSYPLFSCADSITAIYALNHSDWETKPLNASSA